MEIDGFLACGDGNCIERGLFCNGEKDCKFIFVKSFKYLLIFHSF